MDKKVLFLSCLALHGTPANAEYSHFAKKYSATEYNWRLGMDTFFMHNGAQGDFGSILKDNTYGFNFQLGYRYNKYVKFETGFSTTVDNAQGFNVLTGENRFGAIAANDITHYGAVRFTNTHFMLYGFFPMQWELEAFAGMGVGFSRQKFRFTHEPHVTTDPVLSNLQATEGRTRVIGRFAFGAQRMLSDRTGLRLMYIFENFSALRIKAPHGNDNKPFNDSHSIALGVFWTLAD